ncbi:MAG TPA: ribosome biogenesis GTPase Der [Burkholderiales bacterium]|nr:ribosome biogenesis GTPase Der [Burkholderiales bacterium]
MKPIVALVGRANVGKSTLFNRLTKSRAAIVTDVPGSTRDRNYGHGRLGGKPFIVVDTGGFEPDTALGRTMAEQTELAIVEADVVIFMVDAKDGLLARDREIAQVLRERCQRIILVVNKSESKPEQAAAEFHALGLGQPIPISAAHGDGVADLIELALVDFAGENDIDERSEHPHIAIVGRPNVGKSTLINTLLGENRLVVSGAPGTTRDAIHVDFEQSGRRYTLIDTAGLRRRGKATSSPEKFSAVKTLQAVDDANVVVLVVDAQEISEQDAHIASIVVDAGRALVLAVNKWDLTEPDERKRAKAVIERKLNFVAFAERHMISALHGRGLSGLMRAVDSAYRAAMAKISTPRLTRALAQAVAKQEPPRAGLIRPKLRYAHQGGVNPPCIVVHGSALKSVPKSYWRYLEHSFRAAFKLQGTPLRMQFKNARNPYGKSG